MSKMILVDMFERWWRKAQGWFATQFASINVDLTPVEEKVDEVKSDVADVKTAVENIDFSTLAKQGSNPNATNTAILAEVEKVTAVDADILSGKTHLASAITSKGVTSSVSDSLVAMATKVRSIPQQVNTRTSDFEHMIAPCPYIWNVYTVATELMQNELPSYIPSYMAEYRSRYGANSFFVGEYYLGYATLELAGADGYLTCDGDFYTIADGLVTHTSPDGTIETYAAESIIHAWHGVADSMANRWVAFFYLADAYSSANTTSSICPRRAALCGTCNSFVVVGENRLTDLWVIGTLGHFEGGTTGNTWNPAQVIQHYPVHDSGIIYNNFSGISVILPDFEALTGSGELFRNGNNLPITISLPKLTTFNSSVAMFLARSDYNFRYGLVEVLIPNLKTINTTLFGTASQTSFHFESLKEIRLDSLETINITKNGGTYNNFKGAILHNAYQRTVYTAVETLYMPSLKRVLEGWILHLPNSYPLGYSFTNLIDITVGEMVTNLNLKYWYPTNVLANATKKAQLIDNIKNHILTRVSDATGGTQLVFTVSTNMYNAIATENIEWQGETMSLADAFLTKNWLLAGA